MGYKYLLKFLQFNVVSETTGSKSSTEINEIAINCLFILKDGKGKHLVKPIRKKTNERSYDLEKW